MPSLPLWKLQYVARKYVFRHLDPSDVFNLSMTSLKSKQIIMTFHKLPPARLTWDIIDEGNFWNGRHRAVSVEDEIKLNISFVHPSKGEINVYVRDRREDDSLNNASMRNVNRTPILMSRDFDDDFLVCNKRKKRTSRQKLEVMEMISRHLLDIIKVERYDLHYSYHADLPMKKFIKCFVFDITKKFKEVKITDHWQILKASEFNFLMNEIKVDEMELNTTGKVKGVFTHRKIEFLHSAVSFDNVLNLQCEKFRSRMKRLLKPNEFVKLLLAWSNGEKLQNLKRLIIHHAYDFNKKHSIKQVKKRIRKLEGEVPFEIMEREQESSDEDDDNRVVHEEPDIDEHDPESESDEEEDETEQEDVEDEDTKEEQEEEMSAESEPDEDDEESDADSHEDIDAKPDSEDEEIISDDDESDVDEMEGDLDEDDDDVLRIKRKSDGKVMKLLIFHENFEIQDEIACLLMTLPIWKLPYVARKYVFSQLNPNDVFNLSMTSMKSKLIIMSYHKLPPARLEWDLGTDQGHVWNGACTVWRVEDRVALNIRFARPREGQISVYVRDLREDESLNNASLRHVNRTPILMSQDSDGFFLVCKKTKKRTFKQKLKVMEMISKHLLDIVNVESYDVRYSHHDDLPIKKLLKCFVFDITREFKEVRILSDWQELKAREFNFLMNEIKVDEMELNTDGRVKGVFTHRKILFSGRRAAVSFDNILHLKSEEFESRMDMLLKPTEFVKLLLAWVNGEKLQNLKLLKIWYGYKFNNENLIIQITKRLQKLEREGLFEILVREVESSDEDDDDDQESESDEEQDEPEGEDVEEADEEVSDEEDEDDGNEEKEQDPELKIGAQDDVEDNEDEQDEEMSDESEPESDEEEDLEDEEDEEQDVEKQSNDENEEDNDLESDSEEETSEESDEEDAEDDENDDFREIFIKRKSDGKVMRLFDDYIRMFEMEVFDNDRSFY